jgi:hypothetical protein
MPNAFSTWWRGRHDVQPLAGSAPGSLQPVPGGVGVGVGVLGQPASAARTARTRSAMPTLPSPSASSASQPVGATSPRAMRTAVTNSSMPTRRSPSQSPLHGGGPAVVRVGEPLAVAVAVGVRGRVDVGVRGGVAVGVRPLTGTVLVGVIARVAVLVGLSGVGLALAVCVAE